MTLFSVIVLFQLLEMEKSRIVRYRKAVNILVIPPVMLLGIHIMSTQILLRLLLFSSLPNVSQVRPCLASKIRCDRACNNVKKNKP